MDAKRKRTDEFALVDKKWKEIQKMLWSLSCIDKASQIFWLLR